MPYGWFSLGFVLGWHLELKLTCLFFGWVWSAWWLNLLFFAFLPAPSLFQATLGACLLVWTSDGFSRQESAPPDGWCPFRLLSSKHLALKGTVSGCVFSSMAQVSQGFSLDIALRAGNDSLTG